MNVIEMRNYCSYYIPSAIKHAILFQHLHPQNKQSLGYHKHCMLLLLHAVQVLTICFLDHNFTQYLKLIEKVPEKL